ncbi:MAG: hypothetical protein D6780_00235, partial [Candidatus Dadabacteria bacterium]
MSTEQPLHTQGVIADYFTIENFLLATRTAEAYRAVHKSQQVNITLWVLRHPIPVNSDAVRLFLSRLDAIDALEPPVSPMQAYGVDAQGMAFAILPQLSGANLRSGKVSTAEAERRFIACLKLISRLHEAGIVCGDLCDSSFWLNREGNVEFIGVMGSFDTEATATALSPPLNTIPFLSPEQQSGGAPQMQSDVFALGVLGYLLLTKTYPFGEGAASLVGAGEQQFREVSRLIASPPAWADAVLSKCLQKDPSARYKNASEVLVEIQEIRQRVYAEQSAPVAKGSRSLVAKDSPQVSVFSPPSASAEKEVEKRKDTLPTRKKGKILKYSIYVFLVALLFVLVAKIYSIKTEESKKLEKVINTKKSSPISNITLKDKSLKGVVEKIQSEDIKLSEKEKELEKLVNFDDPIAHEILVRSAVEANSEALREVSERAIIRRARRMGLMRSAEQVRQWLRTLRGKEIPPGYEALLRALAYAMPVENRKARLREAYASHPLITLKVAVALALDLNQIGEYESLIQQLVGDSLKLSTASNHSALALILAHPQLAFVFGEDVIQRRDELPDKDILWLLAVLGKRNDLINVRAIASTAIERGILNKVRSFFLKLIRDRDDIPPGIVNALIRAGAGVLTEGDINELGKWYDIDAERVLLAILIDVEDKNLLRDAFDTLAGKSLSIEPSASLVEWIRNNMWSKRIKLAKFVGIVGSPSLVTPQELEEALKEAAPFMKSSRFVNILLSSKQPIIIKNIVTHYSHKLSIP